MTYYNMGKTDVDNFEKGTGTDTRIYVTSQGERVPRGMGIQYSKTNILGDTSKYMNNRNSFILN